MPCNLFAVGVGQETAQQLDRPRCIQMHSGFEGERLVVQRRNIGQGNQKNYATHMDWAGALGAGNEVRKANC